ncbi:hypothetical protein JHK87_033836 [Glycine soja]|nr:hypothetical protein JHK87_033836 [Glycine soja]
MLLSTSLFCTCFCLPSRIVDNLLDQNNLMEIRTDALKLLVILRRHVPRAAATVGVWLNIFQFLILMSICTNCAILAWLYDEEGKWKIEPGLASILIMEHVLLLTKFGFSRFFPEIFKSGPLFISSKAKGRGEMNVVD